MSGTFSGGIGRGPDLGSGLVESVRQIADRLRPTPERHEAAVDVRSEVLLALTDRDATGSEIVALLRTRSDASDRPGAGAVYPVLQLLADEGLVTGTDVDGRTRWSLTDAGRVAAEAARPAATNATRAPRRTPAGRGGLTRATVELAQTAALVGQTGTREQVADAVAELDASRRRLLAILTRD